MLIDFSVSNYKSIKDEIVLSMVADHGKEHRESHVVTPTLSSGARSTPLLRSAVIYGPNAAGKTNLMNALRAFRNIVSRSARGLDELPVTPFRFDQATEGKPTALEATFISDGVRYQYGFEATNKAIVREWLFAWPRGRVQMWFERGPEIEGGFRFGHKLTGDREVWRRATRDDALLLSTAASLNSKQLQPVFDWFSRRLRVAGIHGWNNSFSVECCRDERKDRILRFLRTADLAIADVRLAEDDEAGGVEDADKDSRTKTLPVPQLLHELPDGISAELDLEEESRGTRKIFSLAGPWLDTLENGYVVVFDEMHGYLHPALVKFLVERFHDPRINRNGAQLIFTTHETAILSQDIFRRDQVWFCKRNDRQETTIYPLTDFHPRKGSENLERAYLAGRYGAVPFLQPELLVASDSNGP